MSRMTVSINKIKGYLDSISGMDGQSADIVEGALEPLVKAVCDCIYKYMTDDERIEAINIAQKDLRENDTIADEPLTLEQLRKMDGNAVRVFPKNEHSELGGVCVVSVGEGDEYSGAYIPGVDHWYWSFDSYNDQWIAYAY